MFPQPSHGVGLKCSMLAKYPSAPGPSRSDSLLFSVILCCSLLILSFLMFLMFLLTTYDGGVSHDTIADPAQKKLCLTA